MKYLTFDTSLDKTYVTLCNEQEALETQIIESHDDKYHSAFLIQNLVLLLKKYNLTMKDINAIGVNIGPGSFTGIRACLTIARVVAQQLDIPLIGVSSMEILSQINPTNNETVVVMDARKNMCYYAKYDASGVEIQKPQLILLEDLTFNVNTQTIISDKTMQEFLANKNIETICYTDINQDLGKYLAKITYKSLQSSNDYHWAKVKPLYLQKPSITLPKKQLI